MLELSARFEANVGSIVEGVVSAATELQVTSRAMAASVEETTRQSTAVTAASGEVSNNVQTVGAATEELTASIAEISHQIARASGMVKDGVRQASMSNLDFGHFPRNVWVSASVPRLSMSALSRRS